MVWARNNYRPKYPSQAQIVFSKLSRAACSEAVSVMMGVSFWGGREKCEEEMHRGKTHYIVLKGTKWV